MCQMRLLAARPSGRLIFPTRTNEYKEYYVLIPDSWNRGADTQRQPSLGRRVSDVRVGVHAEGAANSRHRSHPEIPGSDARWVMFGPVEVRRARLSLPTTPPRSGHERSRGRCRVSCYL